MPTAFYQATKSSVPFILAAILRWVILFRERYQLTLLVTRIISRVSFANRVSKIRKKQESLLQALIKRNMLLYSYVLLYTNFCERNQFLFWIKRLSKFSVQMLWDMCLLFVKTLVVIIKSTVVPLYTLHKCIVIAWIARALQKIVRSQLMQTRLLHGLI